ncbi:hypothetical protein MRX96_005816 [Rhipicephalus microplus]
MTRGGQGTGPSSPIAARHWYGPALSREPYLGRSRPALSREPLSQASCLFLLTGTLPISIRVLGVGSKGHTPRAALLQETCALIEQRYSGHLHLITDGSATAASVIPGLRDERKCRLPLPAISTTAELAALNLAADQLAELLPSSAVIF